MTRRGFTLIEIVVALSLSTILLGLVYQFWSSATRYSAGLERRIEVISRAQLGLQSISRELQRARRLVYPAAGAPEQPGVGVVTGAGEVVMYSLEREAGRLVRHDVATGKKTSVIGGVLDLWCRTPAVPTGRSPDLVHFTLAIRGPDDRPLYLVTSAHLRALDIACPTNR